MNNSEWVGQVDNNELATVLEHIARQSTADVNYYVYLEAARRLRAAE